MKDEKAKVKNLNVREENVDKLKASKGYAIVFLPIALLILILDGPSTPIMYGALAGVVLGGIKALSKKK